MLFTIDKAKLYCFDASSALTETRLKKPSIGIILCQINRMDLLKELLGRSICDGIAAVIHNMLKTYMPYAAQINRVADNRFEVIFHDTNSYQLQYNLSSFENAAMSFKDNEYIYKLLQITSAIGTSSYENISSLAEINLFNSGISEDAELNIIRIVDQYLSNNTSENQRHYNSLNLMAETVGTHLQLSVADMQRLYKLVRYHDIGKIKVPLSILNKHGSLNHEEWTILQGHSLTGCTIATSIDYLREISQEILHHHENYDGSGYPNALKGEEIPLLSRVMRVIDSFDCMLHQQPYHKPIPNDLVVEELKLKKGITYDPDIVDIIINYCIE